VQAVISHRVRVRVHSFFSYLRILGLPVGVCLRPFVILFLFRGEPFPQSASNVGNFSENQKQQDGDYHQR
jgi:hypothetical protein